MGVAVEPGYKEYSVDKKQPELRVRRTRKLLWKALIELTTEKGYDSVTVKDITGRAMINRVTFYRHYEDKNDLLMRGMDEIMDDLNERSEPPLTDWRISLHEPPSNALVFFEHVWEYAQFYRVMLGKRGVPELGERMQRHIDTLFQERIELVRHSESSRLSKTLVPTDLAVYSISTTVLAIAKWWVNNDLPCTAHDIAMYTTRLIVLGAYRSIGVEFELPAELRV